MRLSVRVSVLSLVVAALLTFGWGAGEAAATHASCGDTITTDTTLDSDLVNCPENGVVIGADNITLDLAGHTIDAALDGTGSGVLIASRRGVTVKNGTVQEFNNSPIRLRATSDNRLEGLNIATGGNGSSGIAIEATASRTLITDTTAVAFAISASGPNAIEIAGDANVVEDSVVRGSCATTGFEVTGSDNRIKNNTLGPQRFFEGCQGSVVASALTVSAGRDNQVLGNKAINNDAGGILVSATASGTLVQGNIASDNARRFAGDGITVNSPATTIAGNLADRNTLGIRAVVGVVDGGGNTAQGNGEPQCINVRCDRRLFGNRTVGTSFSPMSANVKRASPFTLYFPATVRKLSAYLDGEGATSGSQVLRGVLYSNDPGLVPGALRARSFQVTLPAGLGPGWVNFYFPFPPRLDPGVYWLGIHSGATNGVARFAWQSKPGFRRYNIDAFGDGSSYPFGPAFLADEEMSIYASGSY